MNERIRELAHEAGLPTYNPAGIPTKLEKFAELIVRNCIDEMITQMWHHGIDQSNNPSFYKAVEKAKQHFGVEE
jgi:hypothetical protein